MKIKLKNLLKILPQETIINIFHDNTSRFIISGSIKKIKNTYSFSWFLNNRIIKSIEIDEKDLSLTITLKK